MANSEDLDEMMHNAAFHRVMHCSLKQKRSTEKEIQYYLEILTCDASIYTMDHPRCIASNLREDFCMETKVKVKLCGF